MSLGLFSGYKVLGFGDFGEQRKLMNSHNEILGIADKIVGCGIRLNLLENPFS